jgi:hypothetical protein
MAEITEFAHGFHYGDYSGVVFYGPPTEGFWLDRLAVSDAYIDPLFRTILDRFWHETGGEDTPRIVSEWNTLTGWAEIGAGIVLVLPQEAQALASALGAVTVADLTPHVAGTTVEECRRCAEVIRTFIYAHLVKSLDLFIESD